MSVTDKLKEMFFYDAAKAFDIAEENAKKALIEVLNASRDVPDFLERLVQRYSEHDVLFDPTSNKDIQVPPRPEWAAEEIPTSYITINAQLCTRDGRKISNARMLRVEESFMGAPLPLAIVRTDDGKEVKVFIHNLPFLFHPPQWVMLPEEKSHA
jgi:hypothetical protein